METKRRKRKPICRRHMVKPETVLKQNWKREEILNTLSLQKSDKSKYKVKIQNAVQFSSTIRTQTPAGKKKKKKKAQTSN
jgi:hypothetical protein